MTRWQDSFQPSEATSPATGGWQSSFQSSEQEQPSIPIDMAKSLGGGLAKGSVYLLPNAINNLFEGPQYLGRGIADTIEGNPTDKNFKPWQPYPMSSLPTEIQPHEPQTLGGTGMDFLGQILGNAAASKISSGATMQSLLKNESSGAPKIQPPSEDASPQEKLSYALEQAQKGTRFSGKPNALQAGQEANQAISEQFSQDTALQRQLYSKLNQIGSQFSMPANEVYGKGNDIIDNLKGQVSTDAPENRTLNELQDIMDNLQTRNGIAKQGTEPVPVADGDIPSQGEYNPGQVAYGMQPSDAVDIKTTINSLLKSGKFTSAGQAKLLDFKNYIQNFLDQASQVNPKFGETLNDAESQAVRVGAYRDPILSKLWKQKPDYLSYKGENEPAAETFDRQANFLKFLNSSSPAAGEAYSLSSILPQQTASDIFRNALLQNKQYPQGIFQNLTNPFGVRTFMGQAPESPLSNLASQLRGLK